MVLLLLLLCSSPAFISLLPVSAEYAAVIKDGETLPNAPPAFGCSMCYSCDNPCLPPPPPPPAVDCSPPPPQPPESSSPDCPPLPMPDLPIYYYSPPPPSPPQPSGGSVYASLPPPDAGGGGICGTCSGGEGGGSGDQPPLPPSPIISYNPFMFYSPPSAWNSTGHRPWAHMSFWSSVPLLFLLTFFQ